MSTGYTGTDVMAFLDYLSEKGLGKPETMKGRKIALGRIMDSVGAEAFSDVRDIDFSEIMHRFANLEGAKFTPDSLKTYKSRASRAVSDFIRYKENPAGFKVSGQRSPRRTKPAASTGRVEEDKHLEINDQVDESNVRRPHDPHKLEVPIPIRADCIVRIVGIPHDLKQVEAARIANVVTAMAVIEE